MKSKIFSGKMTFAVFFIYILAFLLPIHIYIPVAGYPLSTSYILIGAAFSSFLLNRLLTNNWIFYVPATIWPIFLLLFAIFFYSFSAIDYQASLMSGVQVIAYCMLYFVTANVFITERQVDTAIRLILLGTVINSLLGIFQALIGMIYPHIVISIFFDSILAYFSLGARGIQRIGSIDSLTILRSSSLDSVGNIFRAFGLFGGPTVYSWFSTTLTIFALGIWLTSPIVKSRLVDNAKQATLLGALSIFLSWTRSAWLAFVMGTIFVIVFRNAATTSILSKRWWKLAIALLASTLLFMLLAMSFPASAVGQMILSSIGGASAASSNAGRLETVKFALSYFASSPLSGVGFRNYSYIASNGATLLSSVATEATAHNTYLELAVELSLFGLLAFVWLLVHLFFHAQKLVKQRSVTWHALGVAFSAVWITYSFLCMFGGNIVEPKWMTYIWLLAGLQFASIRIARTNGLSAHT